MKCPICNNENIEGSLFCSKCGTTLNQTNNTSQVLNVPVANQPQVVQPTTTSGGGLNKKQKGIILGLLSLVVILLIVAVVTTVNNKKVFKTVKEDTRTIMIYLDGSTLESTGGIATAELNAIDPSTLDLNKTNVLVYTGGTEKWYNYVKNTENAIYKLTGEGFEKIETYDKLDMGDPNTLASFLEYCYKNYKAGHMDLVLFNHGGALDGAIYDDFTNNHISLENFTKALDKSPFSKDNKLELIAFRTCLNGTLENALTFADYSEYLVASEDVTWGSNKTNVFGNFINGMPSSEDGLDVGKRFIDAYIKNMDNICYFPNQMLITYAVIDLSKVNELAKEFEKYIGGINLNSNYASLARVRSGMLQFAMTTADGDASYDTIDMYDLVNKTSSMSTVDTKGFKEAFDKTVVYYYSNDTENTHGLSIYFPYGGKKYIRSMFLNIYSKLNFLKDYNKFISNFNDLRNGESPKAFSFNNSKTETLGDKEVSLTLSDEQKENYLEAAYIVFKKDKEKEGFYDYIYFTDDVDTSTPGVVKTKIGNNLIVDRDNDIYYPVTRVKSGSKITDYVGALIYDKSIGEYGKLFNVNILIDRNSDKPRLGDAVITHTRDERIEGIVKNLNDVSSIQVLRSSYKILDDNGHVKDLEDWETSSTKYGVEYSNFETDDVNNEIILSYTGIEDNEEYYVLFIIYDMNGEPHLNDLIKVGA